MFTTSEPSLYFARASRNRRASAWVRLPAHFQPHNVKDTDLHLATHTLQATEMAPSFWKPNGAYQVTPMAMQGQVPPLTYAVLRLPVKLVPGLTEDQALRLVNEINPHIMNQYPWNSNNLHSTASIQLIAGTASAAGGIYRNGASFFNELEKLEKMNVPQSTLAHQFGLLATKQIQQQSPQAGINAAAAPKPAPRRTQAAANDVTASAPVSAPIAHRPKAITNLQRRLGLKGGHPDPSAIKALRRIWNGQNGSAPVAEELAPAPKPDVPVVG